MKTLKNVLKQFDKKFPHELKEDVGWKTQKGVYIDARDNIKFFITQSIKDALEACRVEDRETLFEPHNTLLKTVWNECTTQYDDNVAKFLEGK